MKWNVDMCIGFIAVAVFLLLFDAVSARKPELPTADLVAAPQASYLGSQMIGLDVYDDNNQTVARIEDIAVSKDGRIEAFILNVGEYLGLVAHFIAVKPSLVRIESSRRDGSLQAHMDATSDQLQAAPEYRYTGMRKACLNILRF